MKAISLWQPWATLMALGVKRIETRSWPTSHKGWLAIHAAKRWQMDQIDIANSPSFITHLRDDTGKALTLPRGQIVALVYMMDCLIVAPPEHPMMADKYDGHPFGRPPPIPERTFGDYTTGRFMWRTGQGTTPLQIPPIPWCGRQGFFDVPLAEPSLLEVQQYERGGVERAQALMSWQARSAAIGSTAAAAGSSKPRASGPPPRSAPSGTLFAP